MQIEQDHSSPASGRGSKKGGGGMAKKSIFFLIFFSTAVLASPPKFTAVVENNQISADDDISVTFEYTGKPAGNPDFSALAVDFDILDQSTSQNTTIINGAMSSKTSWHLTLSPKRNQKNYRIPPVVYQGISSNSINLEVTGTRKNDHDITISAQVDRPVVYVNGETVLTIKIETFAELHQGNLENPTIDNAIIEQLGSDEVDAEVVNGRRQIKIIKRFAIFPSKVGQLIIPSLRFDGVAATKSNEWPGWFAKKIRLTARTNEIPILVNHPPAEFPKTQSFLPLKNLVVIESFDDAESKFEIGKAVVRKFELRALGNHASILPDVLAPNVGEGLNIYADEGEKSSSPSADGMMAVKKFSHTFVPTKAGRYEVPATTIYWWDVVNDRLQTAVIRPLVIDVASGSMAKPSPPQTAKGEPVKPEVSAKKYNFMPIFLGVLALSLLSASVLFFIRVLKKPQDALTSIKKQLVRAVRKNDISGMLEGLRLFKTWCGKNHELDLGSSVKAQILELEKIQFGGEKAAGISRDSAAKILSLIKIDRKKPSHKIAGLYPD